MNYFKEITLGIYIGCFGLLPDSCMIWIPVPGYENEYEINWNGIVRSKLSRIRGRVMQMRIDWAGYYTMRLTKNGKTSTQFLHILLAKTLVANYSGKTEVNHRTGIKTNNRIENLEWVTHSENVFHAYTHGLIGKASQTKAVIDTCTGKTYNSAKKAAEALSIPYNSFKNYLNGRRPNKTCLQYAA